MDFVVVGFGLGALGVLLGVVMLGWLAPRTQHAAARVSTPDEAARRRVLAAERHGTGQAFLYAGGAMLLATVAGLAGSLDDRTGAFLVTTTATVAAIGILLAGYLQRVRNPMPARRRTRSAPLASASAATALPSADTPTFLAAESPWDQESARVESGPRDSPPDLLPASESEGGAIGDEEMTPPAADGSDGFTSGVTDPGPTADSPIAAEGTDSLSRRSTDDAADNGSDDAADNGSDDTDLADSAEAMDAGPAAPVRHLTGLSRTRPDDEDPSSGHS